MCVKIKMEQPAPTGPVTTHKAGKAFEKVLEHCGASLYRDTVDARYMKEAREGKAMYKGSITGKWGLIDVVADVNGYTEKTFGTGKRPSGFDSDNDGIPDAWEKANGLNPHDASDANKTSIDTEGCYTNIEVYCNSLVQDIMIGGNAGAETSLNEYYPKYHKEDGTLVKAIGRPSNEKPIK